MTLVYYITTENNIASNQCFKTRKKNWHCDSKIILFTRYLTFVFSEFNFFTWLMTATMYVHEYTN